MRKRGAAGGSKPARRSYGYAGYGTQMADVIGGGAAGVSAPTNYLLDNLGNILTDNQGNRLLNG